MAAGDVSGLVGKNANNLIGRFRLHDRTGMDEHIAAVDDECVERVMAHDADRHASRPQTGGTENRVGIIRQ